MKETNAQRLKRLRLAAVKRGLCYVCRFRFPKPGNRCCDHCIDRRKKYDTSTKGSAARRRRQRRREARVMARRKSHGLCIKCGRRPSEPGFVQCSVCLDKLADRATAMRIRSGSIPRQDPCSVCGRAGHNRSRHRRAGVPPTNGVPR